MEAAAGIEVLHERGFEKIVLIGNSGGSGVYSYYIQQSMLEPGQRLAKSPVGKPTRFDSLNMPAVDGMVYRSEEHTSELQSLMRISYAVFCLKKKTHKNQKTQYTTVKLHTID